MESSQATILKIVTSQINSRDGQVYFPFIFSLFIFILLNNLIGLTPCLGDWEIINMGGNYQIPEIS